MYETNPTDPAMTRGGSGRFGGPTRYLRVFQVFARNSLVRAMTFRANFIIECITSLAWVFIFLAYWILIYRFTPSISGWGKYDFFVFLATLQIINSIVEAFIMPNAEEFSELVRTGGLDFAMLKPIDTQFLISFAKFDLSSLANVAFGIGLLVYSLLHLQYWPGLAAILLYPLYIGCGVAILYSLMIVLAATTVWLGRNQSIYDFWFYITNFSRYPMEIYNSWPYGFPLQFLFTFLIPILVAVNVPARLLAQPLTTEKWWLALFALFATAASLLVSRWLFRRALESYRSASS